MSKFQEPKAAKTQSSCKINGGCHCQAVQFTAVVDTQTVILNCDCSICSMTGFQHLIVKHQNFKLKSGAEVLSQYQFNSHQAKHLFCSQCGIKSFYQPRSHPDSWSINVNCIDHFVAENWQFKDFNGKNWQQAKKDLNQN